MYLISLTHSIIPLELWPSPNLNILESLQNVSVCLLHIPQSHWNVLTLFIRTFWNLSIMFQTFWSLTRKSWSLPSPKQSRAPPKGSGPVSVFRKSLVLRRSDWCHSWDGDRKWDRKSVKNTNIAGEEREQWYLVINSVNFMFTRQCLIAWRTHEFLHHPITMNSDIYTGRSKILCCISLFTGKLDFELYCTHWKSNVVTFRWRIAVACTSESVCVCVWEL